MLSWPLSLVRMNSSQQPPEKVECMARMEWQRISGPLAVCCAIAAVILGVFSYYQSRQVDIWKAKSDGAKTEADGVPSLPSAARVRVKISETTKWSDLSLSLTSINYRTDPPRYTVTARVICEGLQEMHIRNAEAGYTVLYPKENGYRIEVLAADSASATFSVTKYPRSP